MDAQITAHVPAATTTTVTPTPNPAPIATMPIERIAGADRYETSALLSRDAFDPGVDVVYIANGATLVDALGAGAAAGGDGPVLAVPGDGRLPASIATELARLNPARVVVAGSSASVSESMAQQVAEAAAR